MILLAALLLLALALNIGNKRMIALSAAIGAGVLAPVPEENFYLICVIGESIILTVALLFRTNASRIIARISVILILMHLLGWWLNGYPPESPYQYMVQICEYAEILSCIFFSHQIIKRASHV